MGSTRLRVHMASAASEFDAMLKNNGSVDEIYMSISYKKMFILFRKLYRTLFIEIFVLRVIVYASAIHQKNSLKSETERGNYARFSKLVSFFVCLHPQF